MIKYWIVMFSLIFGVVTIHCGTVQANDLEPYLKCASDNDCTVMMDPECSGGSCSPPCGRVYEFNPIAVNRNFKEQYREAAANKQKSICSKLLCSTCRGLNPEPAISAQDAENLKTKCEKSRCAIVDPAGRYSIRSVPNL